MDSRTDPYVDTHYWVYLQLAEAVSQYRTLSKGNATAAIVWRQDTANWFSTAVQ